jgi:hypothetical protein
MSENPPVRIADGRLYLSQAAFEQHFTGSGGVVLLRDGSDLMVLPVRQAAAGGYLAKMRNSAGDRVVVAPDFFRAQGVPDDMTWQGHTAWSDRSAALVCSGFFPP